jgi:hypothetical protein
MDVLLICLRKPKLVLFHFHSAKGNKRENKAEEEKVEPIQ